MSTPLSHFSLLVLTPAAASLFTGTWEQEGQ